MLSGAVEAGPGPGNTRVALAGPPPGGRAGATLDHPAAVRVADTAGAALAGIPVIWDLLDGGRLGPLADRTDSAGEARARWTRGAGAGAQRAQVRVGNPRTMPPFVITATATAGGAQTITLLAGDHQTGQVGSPLPHDIVLGVDDQYGNPVPHVAVLARPRDGSVPDTVVETDTTGRVTLRWTLGRRAGTDLLRLRARGVDSLLIVVARANALRAANLSFVRPIAAGARGRAEVLAVDASDGYGNPVPDVLVIFTASAGTLSAGHVMNDATGQASTHWTHGAPAEQTIAAMVRGTPARATQTVRVAPGPPTHAPRRGRW